MNEPKVSPIQDPVKTEMVRRERSFLLAPKTIGEALEFAKLVASSELCPKDYRGKPQDVLIAIQMGAELAIPPMQALQNIAVINGRPTMWGDLLLALVQASGQLEYKDERDPQEALTKLEGRCELKRKGNPNPIVRTFSHEMAVQAGLIARARGQRGDGPWITHEGRMLMFRARGWALRDEFADVLKGILPREEVEDYPPEPEPIPMPSRISEAKAIERFVEQVAPEGKPAPATAPAPAPAPASGGFAERVEKVRETLLDYAGGDEDSAAELCIELTKSDPRDKKGGGKTKAFAGHRTPRTMKFAWQVGALEKALEGYAKIHLSAEEQEQTEREPGDEG